MKERQGRSENFNLKIVPLSPNVNPSNRFTIKKVLYPQEEMITIRDSADQDASLRPFYQQGSHGHTANQSYPYSSDAINIESYVTSTGRNHYIPTGGERNSTVHVIHSSSQEPEPEAEPNQTMVKINMGNAFSALQIMSNVKRFSKKLMVLKQLKNIQLHQSQFQFIDDSGADDPEAIGTLEYVSLSHFYRNIQQSNLHIIDKIKIKINKLARAIKQTKGWKLLQRLQQQIPPIDPDSHYKHAWDFIATILKTYLIMAVPVQLAFDGNIIYGDDHPFTTVCCFALFLDIIVDAQCGYYVDGDLVKEKRGSDLIKYFEFASLLSITISDFNADYVNQILDLISLFVFCYIESIQYMLGKLEDSYILDKYWVSVYRIIKLVVFILFFAHLFSCCFYRIGRYSQKFYPTNNWLIDENTGTVEPPDYYDWQFWYLQSMYYTIVTMVSVGYGDLTPKSDYKIQNLDRIERAFSVFFILFSALQISYTMTTVAAIMQELLTQESVMKQKIRIITKYMNRKHIDRKYQERYIVAINESSQQNDQDTKDETEILGCLSHHLQKQIIKMSNSHILLNCPIFTKHFSQDFLGELSMVMRWEQAFPENEIDPGNFKDSDSPVMLFVESGCIEEYACEKGINTKGKPLRVIKDGQYLGEQSFFSTKISRIVYKSKGFTKLISLRKSDFMEVLKRFPDDKERYQQIVDKINIQDDLKDLYIECASCMNRHHSHEYCPLIHYMPDREKIIKRHCFTQEQMRKVNPNGRHRLRMNSLLESETVRDSMEAWREDNNEFIKRYPEEDELAPQILASERQRRNSSNQTHSHRGTTPSQRSASQRYKNDFFGEDRNQTNYSKKQNETKLILSRRPHAESADQIDQGIRPRFMSIKKLKKTETDHGKGGLEVPQEVDQEQELSQMASQQNLQDFPKIVEPSPQNSEGALQMQEARPREESTASFQRMNSDKEKEKDKINSGDVSINLETKEASKETTETVVKEPNEQPDGTTRNRLFAKSATRIVEKFSFINQIKKELNANNQSLQEDYNPCLDDIQYWYESVNMKINSRESWKVVLSKKDYQDLELFHKRLKMLHSKKAKNTTFEAMHEFKIYMIENNLNKVLRPQKIKNANLDTPMLFKSINSVRKESERTYTQKLSQSSSDVWHLAQYLMYPFEFLKKYRVLTQNNQPVKKKKIQQQEDLQTSIRKSPRRKMGRTTRQFMNRRGSMLQT